MNNIKKNFYLFLILFLLCSCTLKEINQSWKDFKDLAIERIKVLFNNVPFINKYISLPPAPEDLYKKTKNVIEQIKNNNFKDVYKDEYKKIIKHWEKIEDLYQKKYYISAKKELKKLYPEAQEFLKKLKDYQCNLKKKALEKYKDLVKKAKLKLSHIKTEKERLKIELYLWKLKILLNTENYDEFNKIIKKPPF